MNVATSDPAPTVGVRELKNNLSRYLDLVRAGHVVIITERGHPVARISSIDEPTSRLADLISAGLVQPPASGTRRRPVRRIVASGDVSGLVREQR